MAPNATNQQTYQHPNENASRQGTSNTIRRVHFNKGNVLNKKRYGKTWTLLDVYKDQQREMNNTQFAMNQSTSASKAVTSKVKVETLTQISKPKNAPVMKNPFLTKIPLVALSVNESKSDVQDVKKNSGIPSNMDNTQEKQVDAGKLLKSVSNIMEFKSDDGSINNVIVCKNGVTTCEFGVQVDMFPMKKDIESIPGFNWISGTILFVGIAGFAYAKIFKK